MTINPGGSYVWSVGVVVDRFLRLSWLETREPRATEGEGRGGRSGSLHHGVKQIA